MPGNLWERQADKDKNAGLYNILDGCAAMLGAISRRARMPGAPHSVVGLRRCLFIGQGFVFEDHQRCAMRRTFCWTNVKVNAPEVCCRQAAGREA